MNEATLGCILYIFFHEVRWDVKTDKNDSNTKSMVQTNL